MSVRQIRPQTLRPGARLAMGLYTRQGVKLLSAGTVLSDEMCRMIAQSSWGDLFLANSAADLQEAAVLRVVEPIAAGGVASGDVITAGGVLALEAGQTVEPHHQDALELGAFAGECAEDARLRAARLKIADQRVAELSEVWDRLALRVRPVPESALRSAVGRSGEGSGAGSGAALGGWPQAEQLAGLRAERVRRVRRILARIVAGLPIDVSEPAQVVNELSAWAGRHPSRFAQLAIPGSPQGDFLPDHAFCVACLSVAMATRLRWPPASVRVAGLAGLLADVGMALVPAELRGGTRPLNEFEINRVRRHPTHSVVLLEAVEGLPEEVRLAVYQHHERENGSGYPRGLRGRQISDVARVVAVADTMVAAGSKRRYRVSKRPYDALEEVIMRASTGVFDRRTVRALVQSVGLFPVGSHVLLSNDSAAVVVGVEAEAIDRPIVRVLQPERSGGERLGLTVHLNDFKRNELWVAQPIDAVRVGAA